MAVARREDDRNQEREAVKKEVTSPFGRKIYPSRTPRTAMQSEFVDRGDPAKKRKRCYHKGPCGRMSGRCVTCGEMIEETTEAS